MHTICHACPLDLFSPTSFVVNSDISLPNLKLKVSFSAYKGSKYLTLGQWYQTNIAIGVHTAQSQLIDKVLRHSIIIAILYLFQERKGNKQLHSYKTS